MNIPSLALLNKNDNPKSLGGERLANDCHGNELWLFRSVDKLANRFEDEEGLVIWSDDIEEWNYTVEHALD